MRNTSILKKTGGGVIAALALMSTSAVFAGDTYVESAPVMPPPAEPSVWSWFVGGSASYVDDWDDELWSFHVGAEKLCGVTSHALFLEVGWAGDDDSKYSQDLSRGFIIHEYSDWDVDLVPVTLNYKLERPLFNSNRLNWYAGLGLGVLFSDVDWKTSFNDGAGLTGARKGSRSDERFFGQVFAGLVWNLSERFEIYGGGRWMYVDTNSDFDIDDNTAAGELGLRFNF